MSDSRNVAIAAATGTYLQFMDSDDWLTPDATERLVTLAEMTRADLVIGDFYRVDGDHYALKSHIPETGVMDRPGICRTHDGGSGGFLLRRHVE